MTQSDWVIYVAVFIGLSVAGLLLRLLLPNLLSQRWFWMLVGAMGLLAGLYVGAYFLFGQWNPQLQQQQADLTLRVIPLDVRNYLPAASGGGNGGGGGNDGSDSLLSRVGGEVRDRLNSSPCRVNSQNKIAWELKPTLTADGYLLMRGQTKSGAQLHNPARGSVNGQNWPAFNLQNLLEGSGERPGRLRAVGNIYPAFMASRLGRGNNPPIFVDDDDYRVTATEFQVRAKLPARLLSDNIRLVVVVWPPNPGLQAQALGAECVREQ